MTVQYSVGKTNCLTELPNNVNLELDPLNVTVVGSPTINNGVVSGFSSTNYLLLPNTFNPASSVWKKYFKIKTPSDISKNIAIVGSKESQDFQHSAAGISNNAHWTCWLSSNGTSWDIAKGTEGTYVVQPDTVYWVTLEFTGSAYILKYSLNGIDYIQDVIINTETTIYNGQNTPDMLGNGGTVLTNSTWQPVNTIYLTECYYTINGKEIWRGGNGNLTLKKGSKVYVPNGFEEDGITKKFDEVVIENDVIATNYTGYTFTAFACYVPELNRVLFDTEYAGSGNGFEYNTEENYLRLTGSYTDATWTGKLTTLPLGLIEMSSSIGVTSIKQVFNGFGYIGSTIFVLPGVKSLVSDGWNEDGTYKNLIGSTNNVIIRSNPNVGAKNICLYYDENGSASSIGFGIYDDTISTLSERDASWTSGHYVYVKDENKRYVNLNTTPSYLVVVTDMIVDSSTSKITSITPYETKTTNDLKNMQIKYGIGNTNCLTSVPQNIVLELDPLNVSVVGTPTSSNGVISGFNASNYLTFNGAEIVSADNLNSFEIQVKVITPSSWTSNGRVLNPTDGADSKTAPYIEVIERGAYLQWYNGSYSTSIALENLSSNTTYWFKWVYDGTVIKGYYSTDGEDFILYKDATPAYKPFFNSTSMGLGVRVSDKNAVTVWNGSIDISQSYIKINNEIWWKGGTGSLTLKAGSKVYVPNGFEEDGTTKKFDEVVIENDLSIAFSNPYNYDPIFVCLKSDGTALDLFKVGTSCLSGTSPVTYSFYYRTDLNKLYDYEGDTNNPYAQVSFPLGLFKWEGSKCITEVYQIFNGFGYIGSTVFALPNVKGLIPDGWNEDGTYKTVEFTVDKVLTYDGKYDGLKNVYSLSEDQIGVSKSYVETTITPSSAATLWYNTIENKMYRVNNSSINGLFNHTPMFTADVDSSGKITSLTPYETKNTNDTIDIKEVQYCVGKTNCLTELPNDINLELDPLNVTVVGTPTNSNGVVSNFSTANYLLTPNSVDLNTVDKWEIVLRAQHNTGSLLQQHSNAPYTIAINCNMMLVNLTGSAWTNVYTKSDEGITVGEWYNIRASFDGSVYKFERAEDNGEYVVLGTLETTNKIVSNNQSFIIGINDVHTDPFLGSIDIPNCHIKINDQMWWRGGTGNLTLKKDSKIYVPNGWEQSDYYKRNVVVTGTPTFNNSIVSGFSTSNYLTLPEIFQPVDNNWELLIKYTPTATPSDWASLIGCGDSLDWTSGVHIYHYSDGKLGLECTSTNGSWDIVRQRGQTVLTLGTTYWVKAVYNKINYSLYLSTNGIDWNQEVSVESTTPIHASVIQTLGINVGFSKTIIGSIDLSESYIKINDEIWWSGITHGTSDDYDYITYSGERIFDEVIVPEDMQAVIPDLIRTGAFLTYNINGRGQHLRHWSQWQSADVYSGSVEPTSSGNKVWYDTTNNVIKEMNDGINWDVLQTSLPFCTFSSNPTVVTSIDQIFNGIGYIGSHYFMTTGVKCLEPDGWNEDGTYKVNERQSTNVYISAEQTGDVTNRAICLTYNSNNELISDFMTNYYETQSRSNVSTGGWYFIKDENQIENFNGTTWQGKVYRTKVGSYQVTSGKITNFKVDNIKTTNDTKIMY